MGIIKLTDDWGVKLALCANAETLGVDEDEVNGMLEAGHRATFKAFGTTGDNESSFAAWNGGYCAKSDGLASRPMYVALCRRQLVGGEAFDDPADAEACLAWGGWEYTRPADAPPVLVEGVKALAAQIANAMDSAIEEIRAARKAAGVGE